MSAQTASALLAHPAPPRPAQSPSKRASTAARARQLPSLRKISPFLERDVDARGEDVGWPAVAVEGRVDDGLVVDAGRHLARERRAVEELAQDLGAVAQRPIADDEAVAARRQVAPVQCRDPADHQREAGLVALAAPARARLHDASGDRLIDLGERPGLVLAVVVADAAKGGDPRPQVLVEAGREAGLGAAEGA